MVEALPLDAVAPRLKATSKKHALQELARLLAAKMAVDDRGLFESLMEREKLGSTGVGHGVAIPHARLPGLGGLHGLFARLERPVDFESVDGQPVDLIYILIAPAGAGADHLQALAKISRLLREASFCDKLRGAANADAIAALLTHSDAPQAA